MSELSSGGTPFSDADWTVLIRSEFQEMRDLDLTSTEMQRLWGISPATCRAVIEALVEQNALKLTLAGGHPRYRLRN